MKNYLISKHELKICYLLGQYRAIIIIVIVPREKPDNSVISVVRPSLMHE
jgi:hypothetical protein